MSFNTSPEQVNFAYESFKKPKVSCCDSKTAVVGRHIWRKYNIISDPKKVMTVLQKGKCVVPVSVAGKKTGVSLNQYLSQLVEYEMSIQKPSELRKYRFLHTVEVYLEPECELEQITKLVNTITACLGVTNETYFARVYARGKSNYLCVYISERTYYKQAVEEQIIYTHDFYADPVTHKCVRRGTEGAILVHRKGDVKGVRETQFSLKSGLFKMNEIELKAMSFKLLAAIRDFYNAEDIGKETYLLPRLSFEEFRGNKRRHITTINHMFMLMEEVLTTTANRLSKEEFDEFKKPFEQLVMNIRNSVDNDDAMINKTVTFGVAKNHRMKVTINYNNRFPRIIYNIEMYVDDFMDKTAGILNRIFSEQGIITYDNWEDTMRQVGLPGIKHKFTSSVYIWDETKIPKDKELTEVQWYKLWVKNGRHGTFRYPGSHPLRA